METIAINFHDKDGSSVGKFHLHAGLLNTIIPDLIV